MKSPSAKIITVLICASIFTPVLTFASVNGLTGSVSASSNTSFSCTTLANNLSVGSRDVWTGGQVTALQNFLYAHGNLSVPATGYFGILTQRAARQFQASQDIPATGFVGPLTRASIQNLSCNTSSSGVSIYSITPNSGPVGTSVSITGFGFTNANTVHLGGGAIGNVPISSSIAIACTTSPTCHGGINQTLTITIPSSIGPYCAPGLMCPMYMQLLTPGVYTIYVQNDNGTSNQVSFTVTGTSNNQAPTITGLDAPATLALGSTGTWTVHAQANAGSTTNLHYSVNWGDQQVFAANGIVAPQATPSQSSATFTHAYSQAGTYTAVFTVSDDNGNSSTVSSTITVTPLY